MADTMAARKACNWVEYWVGHWVGSKDSMKADQKVGSKEIPLVDLWGALWAALMGDRKVACWADRKAAC